MYYCEKRMKIIDEIIKLMGTTEDLETLSKIEAELKNNKKSLDYFVEELFNKRYKDNVYFNKKEIKDAFKHAIRSICIHLNYNKENKTKFDRLEADKDYIDHFSYLYVKTKYGLEDLDIWIREGNYMFEDGLLAYTIYKIYCGKIDMGD